MDVRKTNGSIEEFDNEKLKRGIREAYKTAGEHCHEAIVVSITDNLYIYDKITSLEIRRQVEESLMSINKKVALAYIEKFDADIDLRKKRDFIKDYIVASNAATGSKFDSNANVTRKNIVTLGQELYKETNILPTLRVTSYTSTMRAVHLDTLIASPSLCILSWKQALRNWAACLWPQPTSNRSAGNSPPLVSKPSNNHEQ